MCKKFLGMLVKFRLIVPDQKFLHFSSDRTSQNHCPSTHPYMYDNGNKCCDESEDTTSSTCLGNSINCPYGNGGCNACKGLFSRGAAATVKIFKG